MKKVTGKKKEEEKPSILEVLASRKKISKANKQKSFGKFESIG